MQAMVGIMWLITASCPAVLAAHSPTEERKPQQEVSLVVMAVDENRVALPSVRLSLLRPAAARPGNVEILKCETDYAGRCEFRNLPPGPYQLRAAKEDFYALTEDNVRVGEIENLEITLNHEQEFLQRVDDRSGADRLHRDLE
jgi:hypothetical protein